MRELFPNAVMDVDPVATYSLPPGTATHVRAAMVSSADGAATVAGRVGELSGPADQRVLHLLRALSDVILVGAGTVRAEGYGGSLIPDGWQRYRTSRGLDAQPRLAVLSSRLDLDFAAGPFADSPRTPLVITTRSAPDDRRRVAGKVADVLTSGMERVHLPSAVAALAADGHRRVLCEGGPHVLGQLLADGMIDEFCLTVSPRVVGGDGLRITNGAALAASGRLRLGRVLEDDQYLFVSYLRPGPRASHSADANTANRETSPYAVGKSGAV